MSAEAEKNANEGEQVTLDELIKQLEAQRIQTRELSEELGTKADALDRAGTRLVDDMAKHLSKLREAAGLPDKDVAELKATIREKQAM
jgi:hypothetical protein